MKKTLVYILLICISVLTVGCFGGNNQEPVESDLYIEFMKTGKSDCTVIKDGDMVILCDTADAADYTHIHERLEALNVSKVDIMILTHYDKDHIGSADSIINDYTVKTVYMPDYKADTAEYQAVLAAASAHGTNIIKMTEKAHIMRGKMVITLNPPEAGKYDDDNNNSIITSIKYGKTSILLTGDALKSRLKDYIDSTDMSHYDIIKLPHHGDYNKSITVLFDRTSPKYGIITSEENKETVEDKLIQAMETYGVQACYTADGDTAFISDGESITMTDVK